MTKKNGTILITTLWILAILSVLAIGIGFRVSIEARLSKYNIDRVKAQYCAKAGIVKALKILYKGGSGGYDTIRQCGITLPPNIALPEGEDPLKKIFTENVGDGAFTVSYDEAGVNYYGMADEDRKININKADKAILLNLLGLNNKDSEDIAASIMSWRSTTRLPGGAWDNDYESLNPPYKCKHANFSVIEELLLVKGVTPEIFESIRDYITVYGDSGKELKININTATRKVMLACGLGENLATSVMNVRAGNDNKAGTKDDGLVQDLSPAATEKWDMTSDERNALNNFTTRSNYFRIESTGTTGKSKISVKIACIIDRGAKKLIYYREY